MINTKLDILVRHQAAMYEKQSKLNDWFQPRLIANKDRMWFQFWKPKLIKNPKYDPTPGIVTVKRPVKQIVT